MSGRELDLDALFERDADNRLLERRRRSELGLAAPAPPRSSTPLSFGAESIVGDPAGAAPRAALLRVTMEARPDRELIPGAVVTVVATVHDDGEVEAGDVRLRVTLPAQSEPLADSFARDGIALDAGALLGEGLRLGPVPAGGAIRLRFALRVLPGTEPLDLTVHAGAPGVPAVGTPALRLQRRSGHSAYDPPRPFYELEAQEQDPDLLGAAPPAAPPRRAVDSALDEPLLPPVLPREPQLPPATPLAEAPQLPAAEPEPPVGAELQPEPAAEAVPEPLPEPGPAVRLERPLAAADVRAFERLFGGGVPDGLGALVLLAGIACSAGEPGRALGLEPFQVAVGAALPRALVAARMGKPTPAVVSPQALAAIRPDAPLAAPAEPLPGTRLVAALDARELEALRGLLRRELADPFLRGAQVLLAVAPRELAGVGHAAAARAGQALAAYRVAAGAWLMRVTVRRAVDRRYDPLTADDAGLRDAAAALVTVLREALS